MDNERSIGTPYHAIPAMVQLLRDRFDNRIGPDLLDVSALPRLNQLAGVEAAIRYLELVHSKWQDNEYDEFTREEEP